jgi:hypothetical protein
MIPKRPKTRLPPKVSLGKAHGGPLPNQSAPQNHATRNRLIWRVM